MTKFMLQEVNYDVEIGNGCSRPVGKEVESLVFFANITCKNDFSNRSKEFWLPNTNKQGVIKLTITKVGTSYRVMQFFHEKLPESMPLRDD